MAKLSTLVEYSGLDKRRTEEFYKAVTAVSAAIILATVGFSTFEAAREYATVGVVTIGEWLVSFDFPFPYFAKPITYLSIATVAFWFSFLTPRKDRLVRMSKFTKSLLTVLTLMIAFASIYEVFYNFTIWGALITADAMQGLLTRIDQLNIPYPNPKVPWNLVFATKMFSSLSAISLYSFYLLLKSSE